MSGTRPLRFRECECLRGNDRLADRPERDAGEFQVRPGKRKTDDGDGKADRRDEVAEREPPAGQHEPDDVADHAERAGADIFLAGPLDEVTLEDYDRTMNINVRAPFVAIQAAQASMPDGGRIINIGSCLAERSGRAGVTLYSASKSALLGMTRGLARDLGARGITANVVHPGPIDADMNPADGERAGDLVAVLSLPHYGEVRDIAGMVAFLAGPDGRYVTGASLAVDGGYAA